MLILSSSLDREVQAHKHFTGSTNIYWLNELMRYVRSEGLLNNFRLYPMVARTNYGTGTTVRGLGKLTGNHMTLVNGPTWGASGIEFASASSQYGTIADFLGSETLTVFIRTNWASGATSSAIFAQSDTTTNDRSLILAQNDSVGTGGIYGLRYPSGTSLPIEAYQGSKAGMDSENCLVWQWVEGGGRSFWLNKTSESLSLFAGSDQTAKYNTSVSITFAATNPSSPSAFATNTASGLAFLTGSVTTVQRETITDLINAL